MLKLALLLVAIIIPESLQDVTFYQCSDDEPEALGLRIDDCNDGTLPCKLTRGTTPEFSIMMIASNYTSTLTAKVKAQALGVTTSYALPDSDACSYLIDGECPLDEGEIVTYVYSMPVLKSFPLVSVIVEYSLVSDSGTDACVRVTAQVVSG